MAIYASIGATYTSTRRPDPRVAARIHAALGDAETVINIGAGTGSYEPPQTVLAIEPSSVMNASSPAVVAQVRLALWPAAPIAGHGVAAAVRGRLAPHRSLSPGTPA
jgi:hypothetical protein